jgi:hypothetical protein
MATVQSVSIPVDVDPEILLQNSFQRQVQDRTNALRKEHWMNDLDKERLSNAFCALLNDINNFVQANDFVFVARFMRCGFAYVDGVTVHLPIVLAKFMGISKKVIFKYMVGLNLKMRTLTFEEAPKLPLKLRDLPIPLNSSRVSMWFPNLPPTPKGQADQDMAPPEEVSLPATLPGIRKIVPRKKNREYELSPSVMSLAPFPVRMHVARLHKKVKGLQRRLRSSHQKIVVRDFALAMKKRADAMPKEDPRETEQGMAALSGEVLKIKLDAQLRLLKEMIANIETKEKPTEWRWSEEAKGFMWASYTLSPKAYRWNREVMLLPSATTVSEWARPVKQRITKCFTAKGTKEVKDYLKEWRVRKGIPQDVVIRVTLAFDATSISYKGMRKKGCKNQSCFAFVMAPHERQLGDLLVRSIPHETGRIDEQILGIRNELCTVLRETKFVVNFVATDGDKGTAKIHTEAFTKYDQCDGNLDLAVCQVTKDGTLEMTEWPVSDLLHLLKNARARLAKGMLAFCAWGEEVVTGEAVTHALGKENVGNIFEACNPLDLLKDDLALEAFSPGNLMGLWEQNKTGAYYMLPFVCLRLAVMTDGMTPELRLDLLCIAFRMFFKMKVEYPATGAANGIYEVGKRAGQKKTLWTQEVCCRGCNLCVALAWIIGRYQSLGIGQLALNRIGTHSVECLFGTTRSVLRGDTRWERFLSAQVDAALIRQIQDECNLHPYIRRHKTVAGSTICPADENVIGHILPVEGMASCINDFANLLRHIPDATDKGMKTLMSEFSGLYEHLAACGRCKKVPMSSSTAGGSIISRFRFGGAKKEEETRVA